MSSMPSPKVLALSILFAVLLAASSVQRYDVTGLVLTVDAPNRTVLVSHDRIPGYMDAMTMPYRVDDPRELQHLKPGEKIGFTLVVSETASYISKVHVLEYDSMERDPVQNRRLALLDEAMGAKAGLPSAFSTGQTVSDFSLVDQTNHNVTLSEFKGKVVALTSSTHAVRSRTIACGCRIISRGSKSVSAIAWAGT